MTVSLAVALLALLVSLFALVALVAVYARVRGLEAGTAAGLTGYPTLVGRPPPESVRPGPAAPGALVARRGGAGLAQNRGGIWRLARPPPRRPPPG